MANLNHIYDEPRLIYSNIETESHYINLPVPLNPSESVYANIPFNDPNPTYSSLPLPNDLPDSATPSSAQSNNKPDPVNVSQSEPLSEPNPIAANPESLINNEPVALDLNRPHPVLNQPIAPLNRNRFQAQNENVLMVPFFGNFYDLLLRSFF